MRHTERWTRQRVADEDGRAHWVCSRCSTRNYDITGPCSNCPVAVAAVDVVDELVVEAGLHRVADRIELVVEAGLHRVAGVDPEPSGYVVLSVEVARQLLVDAGWTYEGVIV